MDFFKRRGLPMLEIEFFTKITAQTSIAAMGILGNLYVIVRGMGKSKLKKSTNCMMISLSVALILQTLNGLIDYVNHLKNEEEYFWGFTVCDVWNTLNLYFPMLLSLHCFLCLSDRYLLLSRPDLHAKWMSANNIFWMLSLSYILPLLVTVPPVVFEWYPADDYFKWRTDKECKFKTNLLFATIFPMFTFWLPLAMNTTIIVKLFQTMKDQDEALLMKGSDSQIMQEIEQEVTPSCGWTQDGLWHQQMLALTFWSIYWNVGLFWIPHHFWQIISKITDAEWPRATNFMVWTGYFPSVIVPVLYLYYDVYNL